MEETLHGGYRFTGETAVKNPGQPVVSVITVVYNSLSLIEKTIASILGQTYPNIEFIVIDGGSADGTAEIIRLYEKKISYWISESDGGIYDAMNKGLGAATGDYVWFMNAGDQIYAPDTLEKILKVDPAGTPGESGPSNRADIYYGDTMIVDSQYREVGLRRLRPPEVLTSNSFKKGMLVCHQAIIVRREIAGSFDPQYRHSADFDWVVRALKKAEGRRQKAEGKAEGRGQKAEGKAEGRRQKAEGREKDKEEKDKRLKQFGGAANTSNIVNTHQILCAFLDGGHSKQNIPISLRERFHSMVRHYGLVSTLIRHIPIAGRFGWYYLRKGRF